MSFADTAQNLLANENLVPDLPDYNIFLTDEALKNGVQTQGVSAWYADLEEWGNKLGTQELFSLGAKANQHSPVLRSYDRRGKRIDIIDFHPAWHQFLNLAFAQGMHGSPWFSDKTGAHAKRAAHYLMHGQIEAGSLCPITMTSAAIPLLMRESWFDSISAKLSSQEYDSSDQPLSAKKSMMIGMGMTEKQGGSDLRSNISQADSIGNDWFSLRGHKWFFSSPMSDAHLMLARDGDSYSCFYVPRWLEDGKRNNIYIKRLKDKLGNRSNSSVEVEFNNALGRRIGTPGKGIATLVEMASNTRLDCVLGSTALLRQALVQAIHHARYRRAFGKLLIKQPLMSQVLADMALESESASLLSLRLAKSFDSDDEAETFFRRIMTPAAKFWICKRTIQLTAECMEVWGGNGYIEDGPMARIYREAPVNSIWEGSGNVMCLDVLRAVKHDPEASLELINGVVNRHSNNSKLKGLADSLLAILRLDPEAQMTHARIVAKNLVLLVQADLLLCYAPDLIASAFVDTRIDHISATFGIHGQNIDNQSILNRAWPV